jgi:hypothetical protein
MSAVALLVDLRRRGIEPYLDGGGTLRVRAARDVLTDLDRETLRAHNGPLLALLTAEMTPPASTDLHLWCLVDRLDCRGASLGRHPTCVQALASSRVDRSVWTQLGDGSWWPAVNLRRVTDDGSSQ